MKTDREKLTGLLVECDKNEDVLECFNERPRKRQAAEIIADYLISKGVTIPVRCRECKYWMGEILGNRCKYHSGMGHITMTPSEAFCSYGERKEE